MSNHCEAIHKELSALKRFSFPFDETGLPKNGVYILFETGEKAHGVDRIVRIGTHTGEAQLISRLKQHCIQENKDRSIFRKNIGRSYLCMRNDPYLGKWEWDLTSKKNRLRYSELIDTDYQKHLEGIVTKHIKDNFTFAVLWIEEKDQRLWLERKLISEVSRCQECRPSNNWFGHYSPKEKIRESGLWLVNELYGDVFSDEEFQDFLSLPAFKYEGGVL